MFRKATAFVAAVVALGAFSMPVMAQSDVEARLNKLEAENANMRAKLGESYLEGERANEVKAMISDVLEDSESRNALADGSSTAGYTDGFFLASADGKFYMNFYVGIRIRWYGNFRDFEDASVDGSDNNEISTGFEAYEAEIGVTGHVFDPNIVYTVAIDLLGDGTVASDTVLVGYTGFFEGLEVYLGYGAGADISVEQDKGQFVQSAVERSYVTNTLETAVGADVGLLATYAHEYFTVALSVTNSGSSSWHSGDTLATNNGNNGGYQVSGRVEVKLMGDWAQYDDFASWSGEDVLLVLGAGFTYAYGTNANGASSVPSTEANDDWTYVLWTADAQFEWNGISIWALAMGVHGTGADSDGETSGYSEAYGFVGEASYNIMDTVQIFVRGEGIVVPDGSQNQGGEGLGIVTLGGTWFLYGHNLKVTADVGFVIGTVTSANNATGVLTTIDDGSDETPLQVITRVQVTLFF